eukprot:15451142-Alexandrium_andersonii.AAC.1
MQNGAQTDTRQPAAGRFRRFSALSNICRHCPVFYVTDERLKLPGATPWLATGILAVCRWWCGAA